MLRHLGKVDLLKTIAFKRSPEVRRLFEQFSTTAPIGAPAPGFTLPTVAGDRASLEDYRGKNHVVLEFGSIT